MKALLLSLLLAASTTVSSIAQTVPSGMTYQGRLTDASNTPVPDGTGYEIEVRLWSASTGGTLLWGTRYNGVPLKSGAFNLILGSGGTSIPGATTADLKAAFNTPTIHLGLTTTKSATGIAIPSPTEILPRQQIFSTPYAFRAEQAASVQADGVLSTAIKDGEVKSTDIGPGEVKTWSISDGAITAIKISDEAIHTSHISPGAVTPDKLALDFAILVDEKANGTNGGVSPSASWIRRTLNKTSSVQGNSISLNGSVVTLTTGTYLIEGRVPAYNVARHCAVVRRSADASVVIRGSSEHCSNATQTQSFLSGVIVVTTPSENFEV